MQRLQYTKPRLQMPAMRPRSPLLKHSTPFPTPVGKATDPKVRLVRRAVILHFKGTGYIISFSNIFNVTQKYYWQISRDSFENEDSN